MHSWLKKTQFIVIAASLGLAACEGMLPDQHEVIYFSGLELDKPQPAEVIDKGPRLDPSQKELYEPIIKGFQTNHETLLRRADIEPQLERIENVYVGAGRYLELVSIYQKDVREFGQESPVIQRLAWGHIRLGQQNSARALIDDLLKTDPENATHHFLDGAYWLQWNPRDAEAQRSVVDAWQRAVTLDPNFRGFEGITAREMQIQIDRIRQSLPPEKPEAALEPKGLSAIELAREKVEQAPRLALAVALTSQESVDEPETPETPEVSDTPEEPETTDPAEDTNRQYRLLVARGELLLSQSKYKEAEDMFVAAKGLDPNGFSAEFGQLRAGWGVEAARNRVATRIRQLAKKETLTARQSYDIGLFAFARMSDKDLARRMFERSKKLDPALATRVGIDGLLEKL